MIVPKSFRNHNLRASLAVRSACIPCLVSRLLVTALACALLSHNDCYIGLDILSWLCTAHVCSCSKTWYVWTSQYPAWGDSATQ